MLAQAHVEGRLPALVPAPEIARATYDKYETHLLLERLGLPSPPTVLPDSTGVTGVSASVGSGASDASDRRERAKGGRPRRAATTR